MTGRRGWSRMAHLMWAIAFLSVFVALRAISQRTDLGARDDGRIILAVALVLFVAYFVLGFTRRRRGDDRPGREEP